MQLRALQFVRVCRENLEINQPEVLLSLPQSSSFQIGLGKLAGLSLSEFSLSSALSILNTHIYICTHTHARAHSDLAVLSREELLIQTIVKRKQAS